MTTALFGPPPARTQVKQAQARAKQMADAAGVHLGLVHSITETPSNSPVGYELRWAPRRRTGECRSRRAVSS